MDREKQIEEIAKVIHKGELDQNKGVLDCTEFTTDLVIRLGLQRLAGAKALYNAGYRKQSEFIAEFSEAVKHIAEGVKFKNDVEKTAFVEMLDDLTRVKMKAGE